MNILTDFRRKITAHWKISMAYYDENYHYHFVLKLLLIARKVLKAMPLKKIFEGFFPPNEVYWHIYKIKVV